MKKTTIVLIGVLAFSAVLITGGVLTGRLITGWNPSQQTSVSIFVSDASPVLTIHSPQNNKTYLNDTYIMLNYTAVDADDMWYNLNNGTNTSITAVPPIYFSVSADGAYTLYLFAENQYGETEAEVSFTVDTTQLTIIYDEFSDDTTEGESTDFYVHPFEDLQNLSSIVLEHTSYGKIVFAETINLTADENPDDNIVNISAFINISTNRIEVNTTGLPNFNKSAQLKLYGLTFSNPQVLKDGEVCTSCTEDDYSGGVLTFSVTSFSVYSSRETPSAGGGDTGGTSGGTVWTSGGSSRPAEEETFAPPGIIERAISYLDTAPPEVRMKIVMSTVLMSTIVFLIVLVINLSGISLANKKPK